MLDAKRAILVVLALVFSGWFAQQSYSQSSPDSIVRAADEFPSWLRVGGVIVGLGAGPGIAIWYLWYDTAKAKPRDQKRHHDQLESLVNRFQAQLDAQAERSAREAKEREERHAAHWTLANTNARADLHEMTKAHREDNQLLTLAIRDLIEAIEKNACKFQAAGPPH